MLDGNPHQGVMPGIRGAPRGGYGVLYERQPLVGVPHVHAGGLGGRPACHAGQFDAVAAGYGHAEYQRLFAYAAGVPEAVRSPPSRRPCLLALHMRLRMRIDVRPFSWRSAPLKAARYRSMPWTTDSRDPGRRVPGRPQQGAASCFWRAIHPTPARDRWQDPWRGPHAIPRRGPSGASRRSPACPPCTGA